LSRILDKLFEFVWVETAPQNPRQTHEASHPRGFVGGIDLSLVLT
jgi:hypothetical protein